MSAVEFCGLELAHPVINGSGTFDALAAQEIFGDELVSNFPFSAFVSKTITLESRPGNPPPRLFETPSGMVNSIGLPGPGIEVYLARDLPRLAQLPVPVITNVMGSSAQEVGRLFELTDPCDEIAAVELNVSCPNVKTGLDIGSDPGELHAILREVRPLLSKPLIVKLTPNVTDVSEVARAAQEGGADAVSLVNTIRARPAHPARPGEPWLGAITGGQSGPAIRVVALAQVAAVVEAVDVPVVAMGGIASAHDATQFLSLGARLVAVGTESFRDPLAGRRISSGLGQAA